MTSLSATLPGFHPDRFQEFLADRNEPEWCAAARRAAFETYQELLKKPLDAEEWKRHDGIDCCKWRRV